MASVSPATPRHRNLIGLEADWSQGNVSDAPRSSLPPGTLVASRDFMLHRPGIAEKRGGTSYAGPALPAGSGATPGYATALVYADFPDQTAELLALSDDGYLFKVTAGSTTLKGSVGSAYAPAKEKPQLWVGGTAGFVIFMAATGANPPLIYDGSSVGSFASSPPNARYLTIFKSRIVLGHGAATNHKHTNRLWFSPSPDPNDASAPWDTDNAWVDVDHEVTALASLRNQILIWSKGHMERLTGTTPPPGTDFDHAIVANVGCTDARSVTIWQDAAIFANDKGVYITNGTEPVSLTAAGGYEKQWQSLLASYDRSSWTIATGILRANFLIVTIMNGSTLVDTLVCNLPRKAWWPISNIKSVMYAPSYGIASELYYSDRSVPRLVAMSGIFNPTASNKTDADGTAVTPSLETRLLGQATSLKHFGRGQLSMDMRDAASDNPTMAVSVAPGVEATTYTAVAESPVTETTDETRTPFTIAQVSQGISIKLQQTNASSKTEVYAVEYEERLLPQAHGGQ